MLRISLLLTLILALSAPLANAQAASRTSAANERIVAWLADELGLTFTQQARVGAILELDRSIQTRARVNGLEVETAPPLMEVRFVEADTLPQKRRRRGGTAASLLRAASQRAAAKEWLAASASRTELHGNLHGLRVAALDGILRVLSVPQTDRYQELLGTQGVGWIRQLAKRRLQPGPRRAPGERGANSAESARLRQAQALAKAEKRREALERIAKAKASKRGRGRGRGSSSGRSRGRRRR